jgi:hypothetical protein
MVSLYVDTKYHQNTINETTLIGLSSKVKFCLRVCIQKSFLCSTDRAIRIARWHRKLMIASTLNGRVWMVITISSNRGKTTHIE